MNQFEDLRRQFAPLASRVPAERSVCPSVEALAAAAEARDPSDTRLGVLEHLATCVTCRSEFDLLRTVVTANRSRRSVRRWLVVALPLAAAAGVVLMLRPWRSPVAPVYRNVSETVILHQTGQDAQAVRFSWQPVPGADHYVMEIFTLAGESVAQFVSRDTSLLVPRPLAEPDSVLRWMVRAYLTDGRINESNPGRLLPTR